MANESAAEANSDLLGSAARRRRFRAALLELLFGRTDLTKSLLALDFAGVMATPVIYYNHSLPEYHLCLISVLLFVGFFSLLYAIFLHKSFPDPALTLGLIGTVCVIAIIPTITAGVLPKLGVLVWLFFLFLVFISTLLLVVVHIAGEGVHGITPNSELRGQGISDAARVIWL